MKVNLDYDFIERVRNYLKERKLGHDKWAVLTTEELLDMLESGSSKVEAPDTQSILIRSQIAEVEDEIAQNIDAMIYESKYPIENLKKAAKANQLS